MNCLDFCIENPEYTYMEGFVGYIVPIHHAWLLTPEGEHVDITIRESGLPLLGIPFSRLYAMKAAYESGIYSVLFNPKFRRVCTDPLETILAKPFDKLLKPATINPA